MRKTLLTTVAAAALFASAGIASAQSTKPEAEPKGGAQMKSDAPAAKDSGATDKAVPDKAAPKSNAQAKPDADTKAKSAAETKDTNTPAKTNAQTAPSNSPNKSATDSKSTTDTKSATDTKSSTSSKTTVSLSTEQRTKIRTTVLQQSNAPRVSKVDFQISVGTRVPKTVRAVTLPTTVVEVYPQWRGFLYFIVGDEIVVVEPNTMEIVAVLSA
ncbi:MAG: hypothetical protein JWN71_3492 [Xanthobacteraceae bacterium]|nr:hypothetical protein [Xanthobacteraceae bacterium]